jgi:hypothetical protein
MWVMPCYSIVYVHQLRDIIDEYVAYIRQWCGITDEHTRQCHVRPGVIYVCRWYGKTDEHKLCSSVWFTDGRISIKFVGTDKFKCTEECALFSCSVVKEIYGPDFDVMRESIDPDVVYKVVCGKKHGVTSLLMATSLTHG